MAARGLPTWTAKGTCLRITALCAGDAIHLLEGIAAKQVVRFRALAREPPKDEETSGEVTLLQLSLSVLHERHLFG